MTATTLIEIRNAIEKVKSHWDLDEKSSCLQNHVPPTTQCGHIIALSDK